MEDEDSHMSNGSENSGVPNEDASMPTDDSNSEDEEAELEKRAEELEREIASNKYMYDVHVELVEIYRKLTDLKSLRAAYERFCECYPLTPKLWLSWIRDEIEIANNEAEKNYIISLFELAIKDYLSVNLWQEYIQFALGFLTTEKVREILERGLNAVGMHVTEGSLLWDMLRDIELAHLSATKPQTDEWQSQLERVFEAFRRQLSVPLLDMENTFEEFKQWLQQLPEGQIKDTESVTWGYNRALKTLETYKPFEERLLLCHSDSEFYTVYKDYIKAVSDPSTILCLYERAVLQTPLNPELWLDYCNYTFKLGEVSLSVSSRALRNCPWGEELWVMRLRTLENQQRKEEEVMQQFEEGIACIAPPRLELWFAYIEYVRRNVKSEERLEKLFTQAVEQVGVDGDPSYKLYRLQARLLASSGKMQAARRLWSEIMHNPQNRDSASVWIEYVNLERQYGDPQQLRSLFQRALKSCKDWPQFIIEQWTMYERECGSLNDMLKCVEICRKFRSSTFGKVAPQNGGENKSRKRPFETKDDRNAKRPKPPETKERKLQVKHDPTRTVFVSNLAHSVTEETLQSAFPNANQVDLVTDRKGASRCFGYVQFADKAEVALALQRDREPLNGRPMFISRCKENRDENQQQSFKYSTQVEKNKLFVRGLPLTYTKQQVEDVFKPHGATEVRLITRKNGKPKGLAYVEFPDEQKAAEALKATDEMQVGECTISVAVSAPPPKNDRGTASREPTRHARSRLQVPLIPRVVQKSGEPTATGVGSSAGKSNEDFRKMFLHK